MKTIRIGNGGGFWGDNRDAPIELARHGQLDYLTIEYLAELTMSILALMRARDPSTGYAHDFVDCLKRLVPIFAEQPNLKVVTNAGGMNPRACAERCQRILQQAGLTHKPVAIVTGDDLLPHLDALVAAGHPLTNIDTGEAFDTIRSRVVSANAYLGAKPIATALQQGAHIVITGRVADASLTVGPAMAELNWHCDDWNRLSAATAAGHLIECGAQATGGLACDWQAIPDLANVGYPIAAIQPDGTFNIEKPANTGGRINRATIAEQLLYEVNDPARYLTPDVVADFTSLRLNETAPDVVTISDTTGTPATDSYKVSIAYRDGYTASGMLVISGPNALEKAQHAGKIILERLSRIGIVFLDSLIEPIGSGICAPGVLPPQSPPEVVLRVAVRHSEQAAVDRFTREFAPLVTSGPPGVTGYTTGRPVVREVYAYWPTLIAKHAVDPYVQVQLLPETESKPL